MNRRLLVQLKSKFYNVARFAPDARCVLDVGVANRSAFEMKQVLPNCQYHGLDREVAVDADERALMDQFFTMDLEVDPLRSVERSSYDLIVINHVLEHVVNGLEVVGQAVACLRPGGVLYLEVPNVRSLDRVTSCLVYHFHDDPTHKRLYTPEDLCNAVMAAGGKVIACGAAGTPLKRLMALPRALLGLLRGKAVGHLFVHSRQAITYLAATRPR